LYNIDFMENLLQNLPSDGLASLIGLLGKVELARLNCLSRSFLKYLRSDEDIAVASLAQHTFLRQLEEETKARLRNEPSYCDYLRAKCSAQAGSFFVELESEHEVFTVDMQGGTFSVAEFESKISEVIDDRHLELATALPLAIAQRMCSIWFRAKPVPSTGYILDDGTGAMTLGNYLASLNSNNQGGGLGFAVSNNNHLNLGGMSSYEIAYGTTTVLPVPGIPGSAFGTMTTTMPIPAMSTVSLPAVAGFSMPGVQGISFGTLTTMPGVGTNLNFGLTISGASAPTAFALDAPAQERKSSGRAQRQVANQSPPVIKQQRRAENRQRRQYQKFLRGNMKRHR